MRAFYAQEDTRTPMVVLMITTASHIALGWVLAREYGAAGLMTSLAINTALRMVLMLLVLDREIGGLVRELANRCAALVPATALTGVPALLLADPLERLTDPANGERALGFVVFGLTAALLCGLYLVLAWIAKSTDARELATRMRGRLLPTR